VAIVGCKRKKVGHRVAFSEGLRARTGILAGGVKLGVIRGGFIGLIGM
jgi:hypothetical protein